MQVLNKLRHRRFTWLWLLAGCRSVSVGPAPTDAEVELGPADAEVWLPSLTVEARARGRSALARCEVMRDGETLPMALDATVFRATLALAPGVNHVSARCTDRRGRSVHSAVVSYVNKSVTWPALSAPPPAPASLDGAVIYGVLPPLYGSPPLRATTQALPALAELGVTVLWLSPLAGTIEGDYGYAVTDYFTVRPDYGSSADLRELVARAHQLGLRVLLDFVPNHTSDRHPYYRQAQELGTRSHYFDFYQRSASGRGVHYFDWQHLPNLDYRNPEVGAWISAAGAFWLRGFDVDGFRIDAAWGVAARDPGFYDGLSRKLSSIRPIVLLAEASARDPYYLQHGFDATYDWTSELGHWAWQDVFEHDDDIAPRLAGALRETSRATARPDRVLRFLNNNDTGARFITRHGLGLTRAATVLLLTVPGLPCLFSFDEVGGEFEPYAGLAPIKQPRYPELRALHQRLIALRRSQAALRGPELQLLSSEDKDVSMYLRPATATGAAVLVVISWSAQPRQLRVPWQSIPGVAGHALRSLLEPEPPRTIDGTELRLALEPFGFGIWALATDARGADAQ